MGKSKTVTTTISKIPSNSGDTHAALVVIHGQELGRKFDLERATMLVGRSSKSDIQVDEDPVSRQHARITVDERDAFVEDLGSTNGTYVNDELLKGLTKLRNGDYVKIGRTIFKYLAGGNIEGRYHEEIYLLTTTDGLTQVHNRRYFLETLEREVSRCHRYGRELSLVIVDIDHFKSINDKHGHLGGDCVLKQLAAVIKNRVRREDIFARYGGEEFAIVLPEIPLKRAVPTAERLRGLLEKHPFSFEEEAIPITVSMGVAALGGPINDAESLIKAADARLYEAKAAGRNQVRG